MGNLQCFHDQGQTTPIVAAIVGYAGASTILGFERVCKVLGATVRSSVVYQSHWYMRYQQSVWGAGWVFRPMTRSDKQKNWKAALADARRLESLASRSLTRQEKKEVKARARQAAEATTDIEKLNESGLSLYEVVAGPTGRAYYQGVRSKGQGKTKKGGQKKWAVDEELDC